MKLMSEIQATWFWTNLPLQSGRWVAVWESNGKVNLNIINAELMDDDGQYYLNFGNDN